MAKGEGLETLMVGGGVAAAGLLLWMNRATLFPGLKSAVATTTVDPSTGQLVTSTGGGGTGSPLLTAPIELPNIVNTTLPGGLVVQPSLTTSNPLQPGSLPPVTQTAGCVVGPGGGIICPDFPAAQVLAAQTDSCLPPSAAEINACQGRKPLWTLAQCQARLTLIRQDYCAAKAAIAANPGNQTVLENYTNGMQNLSSEYFSETGVYLT